MKHLFIILLPAYFFLSIPIAGAGIIILGTAQDGGFPHAGCLKQCCSAAWKTDSLRRYVVSFAVADSVTKKWWLFEATPDIKFQLQLFRDLTKGMYNSVPDGIFITHAHIGHYTGLMHFGKEVLHSHSIPVYALPKMKTYLEANGPWSQLVKLNNVSLSTLQPGLALSLTDKITVEAFTVPHRDEFSETAGFKINTGSKKILFIPDIDKWDKLERNIAAEVRSVDLALLDGTFFRPDELPGRTISEVPHPLVTETMELFRNEKPETKSKIFFIHLNHSNKLLWDDAAKTEFYDSGFQLAEQGMIFY